MYVCMYRNPIISRATSKRSITCASVTLRNVTAVPAIEVRGELKCGTSATLYAHNAVVASLSTSLFGQRATD